MGFLTPRRKSFRFKRIIAVALLLTILDGFISGLPSFGLLISAMVFIASAIASIIFLFVDKGFSKLYAVKCLVYLCAGACIIGLFALNTYIGGTNADKIIHSIEKYKADKGEYPAELGNLVPEYMPKIPVCAYRMLSNKYRYSYTETSHYLMWAQLPPYGRRLYHFDTKEWTYID
jgi:predicted PurR-regulated permease PerM